MCFVLNLISQMYRVGKHEFPINGACLPASACHWSMATLYTVNKICFNLNTLKTLIIHSL